MFAIRDNRDHVSMADFERAIIKVLDNEARQDRRVRRDVRLKLPKKHPFPFPILSFPYINNQTVRFMTNVLYNLRSV